MRTHASNRTRRKDLPGALVFAITALNLLVLAWEDLAFEDFGPASLFDTGDLEDLCCVEERVLLASHHGDSAAHDFVDGDSRVYGGVDVACHGSVSRSICCLLFVAVVRMIRFLDDGFFLSVG